MIRRGADLIVLGSGVAAWCAALELAQRGGAPVLLPLRGAAPPAEAARVAAVALGPASYPEAVRKWGRDGARELWEFGREEAHAVRETCRRLGGGARWRGAGGFLLAATRDEARDLADAEDALRDDGFAGEFLDHYMAEARFGVHGLAGVLWTADECDYDVAFVGQAVRRRALGAGAREGPPVTGRVAADDTGVSVEAGGALWQAPVALLAPAPAEASRIEGEPALGAPVTLVTVSRASAAAEHLPSPARRVDGAAGWAGPAAADVWEARAADAPDLAAWRSGIGLAPRAWSSGEGAFPADGLPVLGRTSPTLVVAWSGGGPGLDWPMVVARRAVEIATGADLVVPPPLRPRAVA
jgi:glycine/D-amino acid oxidase-like deaminating enzyme